ncbi:MAG: pullulanase [Ignavibacteria bacterium]|nr:pullulanase [Ignavibacteria bacterium]
MKAKIFSCLKKTLVLTTLIILILPMPRKIQAQQFIETAEILDVDSIAVKLSRNDVKIELSDIKLFGISTIKSIEQHHDILFINTSEIDLSEIHYIEIKGFGRKKLEPTGILDKFYSHKKLGWEIKNGKTYFNLFAPRAKLVKLVLFDNYDDYDGKEYFMSKDRDGVWSFEIEGELYGKYYAYRIDGPSDKTEMFNFNVLVADPYSTAVASKNSYEHESRTLIYKDDFDWEGTDWVKIPMNELVIYEMHVRDMTAHPSSGSSQPGTYTGMIENNIRGGLNYIKSLGVNAVELLPIHDFANWEIPYKRHYRGYYNTWNPYERNHWGYMSTYFFAPESYYASNGTSKFGEWNGTDGRQVRELKEMIKAFHKEGIAVILDVVYNHTSQYDYNPFKYIDKKYYYRLDPDQNFLSFSGCGNDFKTERPMVRRLILESIKYWMTEYKVDGFRFDLANLIDEETCRLIIEEARKINPDVIIIAEPWGGGYNPAGFSKMGWAAWNDQARNGIKGENPFNRQSFIFGKWDFGVNQDVMKRFFSGTLEILGGLFQTHEHSINYLESHDNYTLGDFIRLAIGKIERNDVVKDEKKHTSLTPIELKINKLAALTLFTLQGPVMIHEGQEFARSKVIANTDVEDIHIGTIDENSYNKDNETNYINYNHVDWNQELWNYYKGLIELRKKLPQIRNSKLEDLNFLADSKNQFCVGYHSTKKAEKVGELTDEVVVIVNGSQTSAGEIRLPEGEWIVLVDGAKVYSDIDAKIVYQGKVLIPPIEGIILIKR